MSILIALRAPDGVLIGSDTMAVNGGIKEQCGPKWIDCGRHWIGVAGPLRARNLLEVNAEWIGSGSGYTVIDEIQAMLVKDNWKTEENPGNPNHYRTEFLITDGVKIWSVNQQFSFLDAGDTGIVGSGTEAAGGAIVALSRFEVHPEQVMKAALVAAIDINHNCGGPIWWRHIAPTPKEKPDA